MSNPPDPYLAGDRLRQVGELLRARMDERYALREAALTSTRQIVRHSALAIRALHRGEVDSARALISEAFGLLVDVRSKLRDHQDLFHAGFVHDAEKEYVEAATTLSVVVADDVPSPSDLAVEDAAYLNGLGEAAGELRRYILDSLRRGQRADCERMLAVMDEIYGVLVTMDYPDAISGGLRRTTDMVRGVLERTRGDLTMAALRNDLAEKLHNSQVKGTE